MELAPKYRGGEINNQITVDAVALLRRRNALHDPAVDQQAV